MSPVAVFTRNIPEGWSCDATANLKDLALEQICSVLNLHSRTVDLEAGFLELGGHSLSAIDLVSGCRSHGVHISVENILLSDTIAEILDSAEWLEPLSTDTENGSPPPYPVHKRHAESLLGASKKKQCKTTEDSISSGVSSTGHASPMTEMQLVFVQGSQANPETNTISFYDSYQTKDIPVMKRAWQSVIESESIFRTTFKVTESSGPMIENTHAQFNWMDTVVHNREDYEKAVEEDNPTGEVYTSFNVVTWLKERQETTYSTIVWRVHHAFIDGFSAALVYQKVRRAAAGFPIHAGTPFIQVANKLQELQHANRSSCQRFWKCWRDSSSSAVGDISLPPPTSTRRLTKNSTKSVTISIPVDQLQESARTTNVSVVSIYYAAWAMVLSKYNDSDSVVFGVVLSGRNLPLEGVEDSIGPLVNTIPLHVLLDRSWTTRQYMRHIFKALVKLSSVQYSPSTENFKRDFSSALATEFEMDPAESDGVRPIGKSHFTAVTDVPLSVYINSDNKVRLCYHCDLFNKKDIERLGQNYHSALLGFTGTVDSVGTCMDHILLNESRSLLRQVGNFLSDSTRAASVHDDLVTLFEHAVSENPLNVAVEKGAEWLTYHGLNTKADLVMKHRSLHTRPGDVVCVNADRSLTWIIAIYGILKAGCVYSPLDKALPTIVRDTNFQSAAAKIFLVSRSSEKDIKPSSCKICLAVEELLTNPAPSQSAASIRRSANPAANAYVCFTSGSAGKPKGVMCTHQGLVAFQRTLEVRLFAQPGWKISQIMGPAFDGSIHEIFSALSYGATLVLPDSIDPVSHLRLVDEAILTPSLAQKLSPNDFPRLGAVSALSYRI